MTDPTASPASGVYPCLYYRDAGAAIEWLERAFGFAARMVMREGGSAVSHAELSLGDVVIMVGSARADRGWVSPRDLTAVHMTLCLTIPDPDAHHARAVAAGAEVVIPLADKEYGSRDYTVRDLEGNVWTFGTYRPGAYWDGATP
jgi:uncharacterized glyoxalase superfamily protein PhnB